MNAQEVSYLLHRLSDAEKRELKDKIAEHTALCTVMGWRIDQRLRDYVLAKLEGREPPPLPTRAFTRNGRVRVIR